jgi:hypothetical protein
VRDHPAGALSDCRDCDYELVPSSSPVFVRAQNFQANLNEVEHFCEDEKNFGIPVMKAIERIIGTGN